MVEGFKNSEVGVIPNDWEEMPLGSMAFITKLAGFEYSKYFNSYKDGGDIIVIRGTNITNNILDLTDVRCIPTETSKNLQRSKLFKGDLVFAYVGTIGPVYLIEDNDKFHLGPNTSKITLDKKYDTNYIFNYFKSWLIRNEIFEHTSIGAQPSLSMSKIRKFRIVLPPTKAEQTSIATALNDADALINQLEKLISKKKAIKQGAMQELLNPKEGWVMKKMGEIAKIIMGQSPLSVFYNSQGIGLPLIQGNADVKNRKTIIRFYTSNITKSGKAGDIIMSVRAPVGEISKATFDCCLGRGVCAISFENEFLYHYLISFENSWAKLSTGSTFDSVNSKQVRELEIPIPPTTEEQTKIAKILSDMDLEILKLEDKLEKQKQLKQGMMQSLLTGKIRLV